MSVNDGQPQSAEADIWDRIIRHRDIWGQDRNSQYVHRLAMLYLSHYLRTRIAGAVRPNRIYIRELILHLSVRASLPFATSLIACSLSLNFWIFPLAVLGNESAGPRKKTYLGAVVHVSGHLAGLKVVSHT